MTKEGKESSHQQRLLNNAWAERDIVKCLKHPQCTKEHVSLLNSRPTLKSRRRLVKQLFKRWHEERLESLKQELLAATERKNQRIFENSLQQGGLCSPR